jgi:hypothetical protein
MCCFAVTPATVLICFVSSTPSYSLNQQVAAEGEDVKLIGAIADLRKQWMVLSGSEGYFGIAPFAHNKQPSCAVSTLFHL